MSKKHIWIALVVVLALNVMMILVRTLNEPKWTALREDIRACETQKLSESYRFAPKLRVDDYFSLIGSLVKNRFWTKVLPLAEDQAKAITKLDELVWNARVSSSLRDADYLDGNPSDYREYVSNNDARRRDTIKHAQRMVALGLLTEPQADFVTQHYLTSKRVSHSLGDTNVQELLGMTKDQKMKLGDVWERSRTREARLSLFSVDPQEQKENAVEMAANNRAADAAAMQIVTPNQLQTWSRLTAKRSLPAEPPHLPDLSEADAARIKLVDLSPTFRVLTEEAGVLKLSADQKKQLRDRRRSRVFELP